MGAWLHELEVCERCCSSCAACAQLLGVGVDKEVALEHAVEFLAEDDGARFLVSLEQSLDGDVEGAGVVVGVFHGEVEERIIDGAVHPAANAGIRLRPCWVSRMRGQRAVDVAKEPVLGAEGGEERLPLIIVGALEAEDDRHVLLDVDGSVGSEERRSEGARHGAAGGRRGGGAGRAGVGGQSRHDNAGRRGLARRRDLDRRRSLVRWRWRASLRRTHGQRGARA